jgi:hypothetical protein
MRYVKHNPGQSYHSANGISDQRHLNDLVADDITAIILDHKPRLIQGVRLAGVDVKDNVGDKELAAIIVKNAGQNKRLRQNLAKLVSYKYQAAKKGYSADGDVKAPAGENVGAVAGALNKVFGFLEARQEGKNAQAGSQEKILDLINEKIKASKAAASKHKTGVIIGGSMVVLALGALIYYVVTKE